MKTRNNRRWFIFPLFLVFLGLLPFTMLLWTEHIREEQRQESILLDLMMDIQIDATKFHLWFEELITGDPNVDIEEVWGFLEGALALSQVALDGGETAHGYLTSPLEEGELRRSAGSVRTGLLGMKKISRQRIEGGVELGGVGSELDEVLDMVFNSTIGLARGLESELIELRARNRSINSALFKGISGAWLALLVSAVIGFRFVERRRKKAEMETRLLEEITLAIAEVEDLDTALDVTLKKVCEATSWSYGEAWVPSASGDVLKSSPAWYGDDEKFKGFRESSKAFSFKTGDGIVGRVWSTKVPEWIRDVSREPESFFLRSTIAREAGLMAALGVPILDDDEVVVVLVFFMREALSEDTRLAGLVSTIAAQLGSAIKRKRSDDALKESQHRYKALFQNMLNGAAYHEMIFDEENRPVDYIFLDVNDAFESLTGLKKEEIIGRRVTEVIPGIRDSEPDLIGIYGEVVLTGEDRTFELYFKPFAKWYFVSAYSSEKAFFVVTFHDITERKRDEEELREKEESLARAQEIAHLGHWKLDPATQEITGSDELFRIFGLSREEATLESFVEVVHPEDRARDLEAIKRGMEYGENWDIEHRLVCRDGTEKTVHAVGETRTDETGKVVLLVGTVQDITERIRLEKESLKAQKLESLSVLAGGIAHDFNNLLTGIIGNLSLVELQVDRGSPIHNRLLEVEKSALQASGLTQQLLTFAKGGEPVKTVLSIGDLINETACFALRGSNVKCGCCTMPEDLWVIDADEGQISQVINNLTLNAGQAMPEGGVLKMCAENRIITGKDKLPLKDGRYVMMSFEDQGIGIPKELLAKIFDPYFTTKQKGSGLGLASSYSIIKKHGGHLGVTSEVGVGTTFEVYLPASERGVVVETKKEAETPVSAGGRVLVMDDEEIIRNVATAILTSMSYEVKTAEEGAEAIRLYKDARDRGEPFDAVIMDLTIAGGLGGKEAVKSILEYDPEAKVIVSSGYSNNPVMSNFKEHGFSGVLIKPYKASELGAKVHQAITQKD